MNIKVFLKTLNALAVGKTADFKVINLCYAELSDILLSFATGSCAATAQFGLDLDERPCLFANIVILLSSL